MQYHPKTAIAKSAIAIAIALATATATATFVVDPPEPAVSASASALRPAPAAPAPAAPAAAAAPAPRPAQAVQVRPAVQAPVMQRVTALPEMAIERETPRERAQSARMSPREQATHEAVKRWERTGVAESLVGPGGDVRVAYGYSRPTITCAPLHVCTVRLIAGETITSLALGDTVRWLAEQTTAGDTPVVVIKPTQAGISTNMVITTSAGRVYYMHLVADRREYSPMTTFFDPAAMLRTANTQALEVERLQARLKAAEAAARVASEAAAARAAEHRERTVAAESTPLAALDPTQLDFNYRCTPASAAARSMPRDLMPTRVFGSATHTFVQLAPGVSEMPAVFSRGADGSHQLVNTRRSGDFVIVDGRPERLALALGVGHNARVVHCDTVDPRARGWISGGATGGEVAQ